LIADLAVYLAGLGAVYYALCVNALTGYRGKFFALLAIILLGSIAVFRGTVGTDTANYEQMVAILRSPAEWYGVETGFALLVWLLGLTTSSDVVVVRLVTAFFVLSISIYICQADPDELFFLIVYFIPFIYYQYAMNAMRIGIASIFLLFSAQSFRRNKNFAGIIQLIVGWSFHYSLIFSSLYLLFVGNVIQRRKILLLLIGGIFTFLTLYFYGEYLVTRIISYKDFKSPHVLSGLSKVICIGIILTGAWRSGLTYKNRSMIILTAFILTIIFWVLGRYTYMGLRLLDLLTVIVPLTLLVMLGRERLALNQSAKTSFLVAGFIGAVFVLRGFINSAGVGRSPWVPYELLF
jgi:hypothetical protein